MQGPLEIFNTSRCKLLKKEHHSLNKAKACLATYDIFQMWQEITQLMETLLYILIPPKSSEWTVFEEEGRNRNGLSTQTQQPFPTLLKSLKEEPNSSSQPVLAQVDLAHPLKAPVRNIKALLLCVSLCVPSTPCSVERIQANPPHLFLGHSVPRHSIPGPLAQLCLQN